MNALCVAACLLVSFCLATRIEPWFQTWEGYATRQGNVAQCLLGDSRRMLANHFYVKADAYFHSGCYPSVFDQTAAFRTAHMAEDSGASEGHNEGDEDTFMGSPRDWIEAFGRHFFPSRHTHLDQGGTDGEDAGQEREILPWLRVSVALDPNRVESYVVTSYWLRESMGKVDEAEQFLREGLIANPNSYEILYELGRCAYDSRHNSAQARHLWLAAIKRWHVTQDSASDPDTFMLRSIYGRLAHMEETEGNLVLAQQYFTKANDLSGSGLYEASIKRLKERLGGKEFGERLPEP